MNEQNIEIEEIEKIKFNTLLNSFLHPRETIRYVVNTDSRLYFGILIYFYGFSTLLDKMARRDYIITILVCVFLLILAPLAGLIQVYFSAWVFSWFGRIFKGEATSDELRASILWSNVPVMMILPIAFSTTVVGADNLTSIRNFVYSNIFTIIVYWIFIIIEVTIGIWCFINMVRMISEVQKFSKWKAFLSIILPILILFIIVFIFLLIS